MHSEKRKYIRLDATVQINVLPCEVTEEEILLMDQEETTTKNISAGGILFKNNKAIPLNSLVILQISFPTEPTPIEAIGEVRRQIRLKDNSGFYIGVAFLKINNRDKQKLLKIKTIK